MPLHEAMFFETSPGPVKYAAALLGQCSAEMRLPLCDDRREQQEAGARRRCVDAGLLN